MAFKPLDGLSTDLDLFAPPVVESGCLTGSYVEFKPLQAIGAGPITFFVPPSTDKYIALDRTLLKVTIKVTDSAGAAMAATDVVSLTNYPLNTLFSNVKIELNSTQIGNSGYLNHYRAYLETLLSFSDISKNSHLTSALYYQDKAGKMDDLTSDSMTKRAAFIKSATEVELIGRCHTDLTSQQRLMLNETAIRFTFARNDPKIVLMCADTLSPKVEITDASLFVRKITINSSVLLAHARMLQGHTAKYPLKKVDVLSFSVASGSQRAHFENIAPGPMPSRLIMGLVDSSAVHGTYSKNPYNFAPYDLNLLSVCVDGVVVDGKALTPNYTKKQVMESFANLYQNSGIMLTDDGASINREDYAAGGFSLYAFDLTPTQSASDSSWSLQNESNISIDLGFGTATPSVLTLICYVESRGVLQADKHRNFALV